MGKLRTDNHRFSAPSPQTPLALVTGHSRGLGLAITEELIATGAEVLGLSRQTQLNKKPNCSEIQIDLSEPQSLEALLNSVPLLRWIDKARQHSGPVLLVNNAALIDPIGSPLVQDLRAIQTHFQLNVIAPITLTAWLTQKLLTHERNSTLTPEADIRVLHISSGAGRTAYPGWSAYCAAKAALDHHARAVQLDKVPGLRVCSLAPGVVDTDMQAQLRKTPVSQLPIVGRFIDMKQQGQLSSPSDTARQVVNYLVDSRFGEHPVADVRDFA